MPTPQELKDRADSFPWDKWAEDFEREYDPIYRELLALGADAASPSEALDMEDPFVSQHMTEYVGERIKQLRGTTKDKVRSTIRREIERGAETPKDLSDKILDAVRDTMGSMERYRADRIARTETSIAYNTGSVLGTRQGGYDSVDVTDGDSDAECEAADGQVWSIDAALEDPVEHPNCVRAFTPHVGDLDEDVDKLFVEQGSVLDFVKASPFREGQTLQSEDIFAGVVPADSIREAALAAKQGDQYTLEILDPKTLIATQDYVYEQNLRADGQPIDVLRYGGHDYILDGHHRAARAARDGENIDARVFADTAEASKFNPNHDEHGRFAIGPAERTDLKQTKERAFKGKQESTKRGLTKLETGKIGEQVAASWFEKQYGVNVSTLNVGKNNYPIDLLGDHRYAIEVKAGLASNGASAQHWRTTIGEPGKVEKEWLARASAAKVEKWNAGKQQAIIDRKMQALREVSKATGHQMQARTVTMILHPDKGVADVYEFKGFHSRITWNGAEAQAAYKGSFKYGSGKR